MTSLAMDPTPARGARQRCANRADEASPGGDLVTVARHLTPIEAHLLQASLEAGGVPAAVADANIVQTHSLLAPAVGGASVRVPAAFALPAAALIAALRRGDFALGDDFVESGA